MDAKECQYVSERFLYMLKNIGNIMSELCQQKYNIEQELRELSHEKELSPLSASELVRLALEERRLLRERRVIKNQLAVLESYKEFQSNNELLKYDLVKTVRKMNDTVAMQRNYKYQPKIRCGLKCAGKHM